MSKRNASRSAASRPNALQFLLNALSQALAIFDADGELVAASPSFLRRTSFDRSPSKRAPAMPDLLEEDLSSRELLARLQKQTDGERSQVWLRPAGAGTPIAATARRLGESDSILLTLEPSLAADELPSGQALINSLPVGMLLVDDGGIVIGCNDVLAGQCGLEPEAWIGKPFQAAFEAIAGRALEPAVALASLEQAVVNINERPLVEVALGGKGGRHLRFAFFPVWGRGGDLDWAAWVEDVSELRDQLGWKLELLSMLAHDLRTPLATLKGHATALLANYRRWSEPMVLEFLEAMDSSTDELVKQVDRSLALTRIETGRLGLRPQAVRPAALVQGALERAAGALGDTEVEVDVPPDLPATRVDPARMEEVIVNLLENAAGTTPLGTPIRIQAAASESMLTIAVIDRGPGIPPEQQPALFEKYGQDGGGLGLYISRRIVEAHGGRIWVDSPLDENGGCRIGINLPVMPVRSEAVAPPSGARPEPVIDKVVLVVENEPDVQALLHAILSGAGYRMEIAADGPSALDQVTAETPDIVLLDLLLPRMDGLTVCRAIRQWSTVPVLALTSKTAADDLVAAIEAGADDYLPIPFQSAELLARMRSLLRRTERWAAKSTSQLGSGPGLDIDEGQRLVRLDGQPIELTPTEYALLSLLARHPGQVLTHRQLIEHLWPHGGGNRHRLFVHVNRLRSKLEPDPGQPRYLRTHWGVGYSLHRQPGASR